MPKDVSCTYVRQSEALGLGHAVLCAKAVVGDEPFAVILADDLIDARAAGAQADGRHLSSSAAARVIAVQNVAARGNRRYGIIARRARSEIV